MHFDGDTLNDDPKNYRLLSAGDVAFMARQWDPTLDDRNARACGAAARERNVLSSRIDRFKRYFPNYWYAVDPQRRLVIAEPHRSRAAVVRSILGANVPKNGATVAGLWLGWPGQVAREALVLAVLACGEPLELPAIVAGVVKLAKLHGWPIPPATNRAFYAAMCQLRRLGLVSTRWQRWHTITPEALAARRTPCEFIVLRGRDVSARFSDYGKLFPDTGFIAEARDET